MTDLSLTADNKTLCKAGEGAGVGTPSNDYARGESGAGLAAYPLAGVSELRKPMADFFGSRYLLKHALPMADSYLP